MTSPLDLVAVSLHLIKHPQTQVGVVVVVVVVVSTARRVVQSQATPQVEEEEEEEGALGRVLAGGEDRGV